MTDNLPEVREAREWFRHETGAWRLRWTSCDHFIAPLDANLPISTSGVCRLRPCAGRGRFRPTPRRALVNLNDYLGQKNG